MTNPPPHKRRPSSLTPTKLKPSTAERTSDSNPRTANIGNRSSLPLNSSSSRGRSASLNRMKKPTEMLQLSFSDETCLIDSLLDDLEQEKNEQQQKKVTYPPNKNSGSKGTTKGQVKDQSSRHEKPSTTEDQGFITTNVALEEVSSFDTVSTTPYNNMDESVITTDNKVDDPSRKHKKAISTDIINENMSTILMNTVTESRSGTEDENSYIDNRGSRGIRKREKGKKSVVTLTRTFDTVTRVCTAQVDAIKEVKKKMDSNLERHLKQLAAEMQSVKTKAQADAVALIDQYIEKNKALEQQLLAANCNVDLMKKRIDHLDQNRNKSKAETEELKEELKSARSLLDLNSQELHDVTGRLQELSKANEHKEEQLNTYVSQTKELGKQLETAKNEKKNLEEKLASTNDQLLSTLDAANSEKKRLEEKMEEAHAKLVSLADVYQQQQRTVTKLEQMIEDYEQDAHDKLKAATTRCLDAESQLELTKSANEKLKKKIEKLKELYYGEISKCNRAAEAYRASKKTTSNH
jgi:hypothetical protein